MPPDPHNGRVAQLDEIPLGGGTANAGNVVRIGNQVARPTHPQSALVAEFLEHLVRSGLTFVPQPLGVDAQSRQRFTWLPGTAVTTPIPIWALDENLLVDVALHQRTLHDAAASFAPKPDSRWAATAGDYFPAEADGDLVCHNDICMSNVIVTNGQVTGMIDFDYARPVNRLFDIAVAARHWVPFGPIPGLPLAAEHDRISRFGVFCDVHALTRFERRSVVTLAQLFLNHALGNVRRLAEAGGVGFQRLIAGGYETMNRDTTRWLSSNIDRLTGVH